MSRKIDVLGYEYDDAEPAFTLLAGGVYYYHRPSRRELDKSDLDAWMTTNGKTFATGELGLVSQGWVDNHRSIIDETHTVDPTPVAGPPPPGPVVKAAQGPGGTLAATMSLAAANTGFTGNPATAWTGTNHITLGDGSLAKWNGTAWVAYTPPAPVKPVAGTTTGWPGKAADEPATLGTSMGAGQTGVWKDVSAELGFTGWPLVVAAGKVIHVTLNDGTVLNVPIPAKSYPDLTSDSFVMPTGTPSPADIAAASTAARTGQNGFAMQLGAYEFGAIGGDVTKYLSGTFGYVDGNKLYLRIDSQIDDVPQTAVPGGGFTPAQPAPVPLKWVTGFTVA